MINRLGLFFFFFFIFTHIFLIFPTYTSAYAPDIVPNNTIGVHILEPTEIFMAAKLVNSSGGDWGYVTIPMRSNDRFREKWIPFFKNCTELHLIPIIRIATYPDGENWVAPNAYDLVDFANFLADMPWPTKNRYVILFNEPNHSKEWGGYLDPGAYARLIAEAKPIFKSRSNDFFLLSAGLDMSAPANRTSQDALKYYTQMSAASPDWFASLDGLSFHAYPNPGFKASVNSPTRYGPKSYQYEVKYLTSLGYKAASKPWFITETGSLNNVDFFTPAITQVWSEKNITAITPFILYAATGEYAGFSLLDKDFNPRPSYTALTKLPKKSGAPLLASNPNPPTSTTINASPAPKAAPKNGFLNFFNNLFQKKDQTLKIRDHTFNVEVVTSPADISNGLSGRASLPENHGMLFSFSVPGVYPFWMKDMKFALDFIWIRKNQIVFIHHNVLAPDKKTWVPQIVTPPAIVDKVLEVTAGTAAKYGFAVGDTVITDL